MQTRKILKSLCAVNGVTGFENNIRNEILTFCPSDYYQTKSDASDNLIISNGNCYDKNIVITAHCDEIGLIVSYIEDNGYIRFKTIGGLDLSLLQGSNVEIYHNNKSVFGVIGVNPIHFGKNSKCNKDFDASDCWIDIGSKSKEETHSYVSIGDFVGICSRWQQLNNSLVSSKSLDNRVGVATLIKLVNYFYKHRIDKNLYFIATSREEIGSVSCGLLSGIPNSDFCVVLDATHATDYPSINKAKFGDIHLGEGVVIPTGPCLSRQIQGLIEKIAIDKKIPYQMEVISNHTNTDYDQLIRINGINRTALISIPVRYMHTSIEVASIDDVDCATRLVIECIKNI